MTEEASTQDVEHEVEVGGFAGAIDDGEGAQAEGGVHFAEVFAVGLGAFDDDGGGRLGLAGEELEEAGAGFFGGGFVGGLVEGEAEVDDGDVDSGVGEDGGCFAAGAGAVGDDAHGLKEAGEVVDPAGGLPAGVGEEEVEAAGSGPGGVP
jgi:hypothetical protein